MDKRLQEIRARLEAATPGPWDAQRDCDSFILTTPFRSDFPMTIVCTTSPPEIGDENHGNNAIFIANAPADIEWLLGEVERLRENCGALARISRAAFDKRDEARRTLERVVRELAQPTPTPADDLRGLAEREVEP